MYSAMWLIILAVLIAIEIATLGLTTIWFAGGALAAFLLSLLDIYLIIQVIVFIVISFMLLYFTRPVAMRYFNKKRTKTNYESIIGEVAKVTQTIDNLNATGQVVVKGQEWTARSTNEELVIETGTKVQVKAVAGVKLLVDPVVTEYKK